MFIEVPPNSNSKLKYLHSITYHYVVLSHVKDIILDGII
jgi:hypothetical protein